MAEETNGSTEPEDRQIPAIVIGWDETKNDVTVKWDARFNNHRFILAVLGMAVSAVEFEKKMAETKVMAARLEEQRRSQQLAQTLLR